MPPIDTALTSIQELIERSIFHSIRVQCVAKEYTPNILNYNEDPEGYRDYLEAFKTINNEKGFSIEVFNTGAPSDRVSKQLPRIVVATQGYVPGAIGSDQSHQYELGAGDKYSRFHTPPTTSDLYVNVHIVSANTVQHRILGAIIALALPRLGYIKIWDSEEKEFINEYIFCNHLSYVPVRQYNAPGTMETIYRYVFPDLFEVANRYDEGIEIAPLEEVDLQVGVNTGLNAYTVKFNVMDGDNNPITDATITFNNIEKEEGNYIFTGIFQGIYSYTIEREGFITINENIKVSDEDLEIDINLNSE